MPQHLSIGNGNLSVNFDSKLQTQDFYYPFVGQENHIAFDEFNRIGVFTDGAISWFSEDPNWHFDIKYHDDSLVGNSSAENHHLKIKIRFEDFVYTTHDAFFRKMTIENQADHDREIKLFFHHDFHIYGDKQQETAEYDPELNGILHYRQSRYFFVGGQWEDGQKLSQFATGKADYQGHEGTFRDAEDGHLEQHPIEQGSVDSTIGFYQSFKSGESKTCYQWVIAGKNFGHIQTVQNRIFKLTPDIIFAHSRDYWKEWVNKTPLTGTGLSAEIKNMYRRSLLIMRTQIDNRGAIIASTDSDIMKFNKDTYTYMWPRDGALVASILADNGYSVLVSNFLNFCSKITVNEGFVRHNYTPSGNLGSSWHPKFKDGKVQLPIQEDESALILFALEKFYRNTKSIEFVQRLFNDMVLKIGRFLIDFTDKKTGLPCPSYDLWEERYAVFSYTAATKFAGLQSAAYLSKITGHYDDAKIFENAAKKIKKTILKHLFSKTHNRFLKSVSINENGTISEDPTIDASLAFIWQLGVLPADDPRIVSTMEAIEKELTVKTHVGGICRYSGDFYQRNWNQHYSADVPGNPWIITTLWLANWKIEMAKTKKALAEPKKAIEWAIKNTNPAGIMPEQMDPFSGEPLSVAPLTWSHATFVDTVQRFLDKYKTLKK